MLINDVLKCNFSSWYPLFSHLTVESDIFEIDDKFRDYLLSDGIMLPECCNLESSPPIHSGQNDWNDDVDHNDNGSNYDDDEDEINIIEFPNIEKKIRRSLRKYGSVFPKLNWSSCEDANWIQANGTKCSDLTSIFLILKSSDKIVHDLTDPFEHCIDFDDGGSKPKFPYQLILRKWININPSMEFRCFISDQKLLAICQRDVRSYYEHIKAEKSQIIEDIQNFFDENVRGKFPLKNSILLLDVIDILRSKTEPIKLIDVNVFGKLTDSLLFDWDELNANAQAIERGVPISTGFRYIENRFGVQPGRFELNSLPLDVFNGNINNVYDDNSISTNDNSNNNNYR